MKTIVLATDFSKNADNAADYAVQLARDWSANLVLFHAYRYPPENLAKGGDFPLSLQLIREQGETALQRLADRLRRHVTDAVPVRWVQQEGYVLPTIQDVTREQRADLLIMSTVGTAPEGARLFGSIATELIPLTNVPLLLIPPGITYAPVRSLVLGVDLDTPPNAVVFDAAMRLARQFGAVVNVICVDDQPTNDAVREGAAHIRYLLREQPHTLTIRPGGDVFETLFNFARTNRADLIMMLPQARSWLARLFNEGETQRLARLADIPVMAVV